MTNAIQPCCINRPAVIYLIRGTLRVLNIEKKKSLLETLRQQGYRLTPQRMMVLDAIEASEDHSSAEEIHARARAKYPYINISTVYRTLDMLKEIELVTETELGVGASFTTVWERRSTTISYAGNAAGSGT